MKKILLLLITVCLGAAITAQIPDLKTSKRSFDFQEKVNSSKGALLATEKLDSTITENWTGSSWISSGKKKYTYLVNGYTTTVTGLTRDASTAFLWVNYSKTETTVNAGGQETLYISSSWNNTTSQWVPGIKIESTYDGTGKPTLDITSIWNSGTSGWMGLSKTEYFYSGANLSYDISYTWDFMAVPAAWVKSDKSEYTYSGSNMIKEELYEWDAALAVPDWVKSEKTEFTFNAGGKTIMAERHVWNPALAIPDYIKDTKNEYTYDSNGNQTLQLGYTWDLTLTTPAWVNDVKSEYSWDASGRNTMYAYYNWDKNIPGWVGFIKGETTYVTATVNYAVTVGSSWVASAWANSTRSTSYYSALTTGIGDKKSDLRVNVYPNPASEYITFSGITGEATVELINMNGGKVLEQKLSDNGMLSVGHLSKGVFVYRVYTNGLTYTGRVVLK